MKEGAAIRFEDVSKRFDDLQVLRELSLEIPWGELTTILGPSGCGKSVALKHIIGIERADSGCVVVDGYDMNTIRIKDLKELRKRIGVLFQSSALFDSMTVRDNVAFGLRMHTHMSRVEIDDRVRICLEEVALAGSEETMPVDLSGGMRKRAALARAIAMSPDFVLYDEPTTGLDPHTANVVAELILKLQDDLDITSVVVTHDIPLALRSSDKIALIGDGRIAAEGRPEEIKENAVFKRFAAGQSRGENEEP